MKKNTKSSGRKCEKNPGSSTRCIKGVETRELKAHYDSRGWLTEVWRSDGPEKRKPAMMYVSVTRMGITRGPHEHKRQTDAFVFLGGFRVVLWDARKGSRTEYLRMELKTERGRPMLIVVPPGVVHAYTSLEAGGMVLNMPDKLYGGRGGKGKVDEIRHEEDQDSAYSMYRS